MNKREDTNNILANALQQRNNENVFISWDAYEELEIHAVARLCAPIYLKLSLPDELRTTWKASVIQQIGLYTEVDYGTI